MIETLNREHFKVFEVNTKLFKLLGFILKQTFIKEKNKKNKTTHPYYLKKPNKQKTYFTSPFIIHALMYSQGKKYSGRTTFAKSKRRDFFPWSDVLMKFLMSNRGRR